MVAMEIICIIPFLKKSLAIKDNQNCTRKPFEIEIYPACFSLTVSNKLYTDISTQRFINDKKENNCT